MIRKTNSISINILSVFLILMSVLFGIVGYTNSYFTDEFRSGVQIDVVVANLNLRLYQTIGDSEKEILTNVDNSKDPANAQYVQLEGELLPDENVGLVLTLKNEDNGSASMYVKFRFELWMKSGSEDSLVATTLSGVTSPNGETKGFVENDGWYYYKDSSDNNATFTKDSSIQIMNGFVVPYTSFIDNDGDMKIADSNTLYIKLFVEASTNSEF